jgi:hypothetical protein
MHAAAVLVALPNSWLLEFPMIYYSSSLMSVKELMLKTQNYNSSIIKISVSISLIYINRVYGKLEALVCMPRL